MSLILFQIATSHQPGHGLANVGGGGPLALSLITDPSSTATNDASFARQPVVQLSDNASGVTVTAVGIGTSTLGGTLTAVTDGSGRATFTNLKFTGPIGTDTIAFSAPGGYTGVTSGNIVISAGAATQLGITRQPSSVSASGSTFSVQPIIQLRDISGNPVAQASVNIAVVKASGPSTLSGTSPVATNAFGSASWTDLAFTGTDGDVNTLAFSSSGKTGVTSSSVTIGDASALDAPSYVRYIPRAHPDDVVADALAAGTALATLPDWNVIPDTAYEHDTDGTLLTDWYIDTSLTDIDLFTNSTNEMLAIAAAKIRAQHTKIIRPAGFASATITADMAKSGAYWTYFQSEVLPCAEGERTSPALMAAADASQYQIYGEDSYPIGFTPTSHRIRFIGIQFVTDPRAMTDHTYHHAYTMFNMRPPDEALPQPWANRFDRVILDRCEFRSDDYGDGNSYGMKMRNGVTLSGSNWAVIDSYIWGFADDFGSESHGIITYGAVGFKIDNNYISAGSSCVFFGGTQPDYDNFHTVEDGVVRHNWFSRPLSWNTYSDSWDGINTRLVKNNFESKYSKRVICEGNVSHRSYIGGGGQYGQLWGVKSGNDNGFDCSDGMGNSIVGTFDMTIRWNDGRDASLVLELEGAGGEDTPVIDVHPVTRLSFYHNRADRIGVWDNNPMGKGGGFHVSKVNFDVYIGYNTSIPTGETDGEILRMELAYPGFCQPEFGYPNQWAERYAFRNNITAWFYFALDGTAWTGSGGPYTATANTALARYTGPPGGPSSYSYDKNFIMGGAHFDAPNSPTGTTAVSTIAAMGLKNLAARNLRLARVAEGDSMDSPWIGLGYNGTDPGANNSDVELACSLDGEPVGTL